MKGFKRGKKKKKEGRIQYETNMLEMELTWKEQSHQNTAFASNRER